METKIFTRKDVHFRFYDSETGSIPFVFQHGIGGNLENVISLFKLPPEVRLISLDVRGHGETAPIGNLSEFNLYTFVDDVMALLDYLKIPKVIFGGMSMGAAEALNAAIRYPERLNGAILYRPAWFDGTMSDVAQDCYKQIVECIRGYGAIEGKNQFINTALYQELLQKYPDTAKSMISQFTAKGAVENIIRFERLPYQKAIDHISQIASIQSPTLIISTKLDPVHLFEYGKCTSCLIPHSTFVEVQAKSISVENHISESQEAISAFLLKKR